MDKEITKDFELLSEYMDIYIQLLPYCVDFGGSRLHKPQLPTFEYFKSTYSDDRYSMANPHYKEAKDIMADTTIIPVYTHGIGNADTTMAYRPYNFWMGCKYYTGKNIPGNYIVNGEIINNALKNL